MTVEQYQRIYAMKSMSDDEFDQIAWMICECFNLEFDKVNELSTKQFSKLVNRLNKKLNTSNRFSLNIETNAKKISLGQFIECVEWLKGDPIMNLHMVSASVLKKRTNHQQDADRLLKVNVRRIHDKVTLFIESLQKLIDSYSGLFEIEHNEDEVIKKKPHIFLERYGWLFSAKEVAQFHGIKLDEAFNINIIEALNTLSYLKSKSSYEIWLSKQ